MRPTICGQAMIRLSPSGIGAPSTAPWSWLRYIGPSERVVGLRTASTTSPYSVLGESRDRYCAARINVSSSLDGVKAIAIAGANIGQIRVRNQSPSDTRATVAGERNMIENSI